MFNLTADETRFGELTRELIALIDRLPEQHWMERQQGYDKVSVLTDWLYARVAYRVSNAESVRAYQAKNPESSYGAAERRLDKLEAQGSNLAASVRHVKDALTRIESRQITTRA